ncbi:PaaI family thioesterase [Kiloniella laminariae]|uniref:PaaI family thioesterase n=1 Tax=Kiloniella laminariae TaxID=454162 RepID=UPI00036F7056|nr:PaaI family thioesterase [Kiloniella laminariae]
MTDKDNKNQTSSQVRPGDKPEDKLSNFGQHMGYELGQWSENRATVILTIAECHLNRAGIMHGGVLATLIDTACGYAIIHNPDPSKQRRAVTLSLTTLFTAPANVGDTLYATGIYKGGGKSTKFLSCEVFNQHKQLVGQGEAVMKIF